jgi:hypothetical protein
MLAFSALRSDAKLLHKSLLPNCAVLPIILLRYMGIVKGWAAQRGGGMAGKPACRK